MSEQTVPEQAPKKKRGAGGVLGDLMDIIEAGLMTVFLFLLLYAYLVRPVTVDGGSMNPTLLNKDQILIVMTLRI
jgi:signal peptidase I